MIHNNKVLGIIPARGGSKGLPGKNLKNLGGKPLIAWSIGEVKKSKYIDRCIVSTDDEGIAQVAKKYGCEVPFIRPVELATDDANSNDVILHALDILQDNYDIVTVLQPTSPLRKTEDIDYALEFMIEKNAQAVVSVCKSNKPIKWHFTIERDHTIKPVYLSEKIISNRQEHLPTYIPNGALYIAQTDYFKKEKTFYTDQTLAYVMLPGKSVDIDNQIDFLVAEALIK